MMGFPSPPPGAFAKVLERKDEFISAGWSEGDLFDRHPAEYGHHGLAWSISASQQIGTISTWWCELWKPASGPTSAQKYFRESPLPELIHKYGPQVMVGCKLGHNFRPFTEADLVASR